VDLEVFYLGHFKKLQYNTIPWGRGGDGYDVHEDRRGRGSISVPVQTSSRFLYEMNILRCN